MGSTATDALFASIAANDAAGVSSALASGASANATHPTHEVGISALSAVSFVADNVSLLNTLLSAGASPSAVDLWQRTPLHWAFALGRSAIVAALLSIPGDHRAVADRNGWTPLHFAADQGNADAVTLLLGLGTIDICAVDRQGNTALMLAAERGDVIVMEQLLQNDACATTQNARGETAASKAARSKNAAAIAMIRRATRPSATFATRSVASTTYTVTVDDEYVHVTNTAGACTVTLPRIADIGGATKKQFVVVDATPLGSGADRDITIVTAAGDFFGSGNKTSLRIKRPGGVQTVWCSGGNRWASRSSVVEDAVDKAYVDTARYARCTVSAFTVGTTDAIVGVAPTTSGAVVVTLPPSQPARLIFIKDEAGTAGGASPITVQCTPASGETINGVATSVAISANYGSVRVYCNGTGAWFTI